MGTALPKVALPSAISPRKSASGEEEQLLTATLAGDQGAFATLMRRHRKMVLSVALNITGNREDAEEAVQDVFIKALRYLPTFRGDSNFGTWLYRIARTTALDQLRRQRFDSVSLDAPESPAFHLQDRSDNGLQRLMRDERARLVRSAMRRLSKEDETALQLFYFHEKSLEEISATTGWTITNAKSRLSRARKRLGAVLGTEISGIG